MHFGQSREEYVELNDINHKKDLLYAKFTDLLQTNTQLKTEINTRKQELSTLNNKIENVEEIIGIRTTDNGDTPFERIELAQITLIEKKYMLSSLPTGNPLKSLKVTSNYGWRTHPVTGSKEFHPGIDFRAKNRTRIYAPTEGVIKYAGYNSKGYGYMIIVSHNYGFETLYAHLSKIKVKIGDVVVRGDVIGLTGNSGLSSGPHLHYEIRYAQRTLNPNEFFRWNMSNYEQIFKKVKRVKWHSLIKSIRKQTKIFQQR